MERKYKKLIPKKPKTVAVLIAYKAENTLLDFWKSLPKKYFDECILVDDASSDKTYKIAKKIDGLTSYQNPVNLGYGGNLKRAIAIALDHGADIIVDIHPDGEYKPSAIPMALKKIRNENYELILGNRFSNTEKLLKSGILPWKILPLKILNFIDRIILDLKISDFHEGFRVYTRSLFEKVSFEKNSDNYLFSFELIVQSVFAKIRIGEVPVETNYTGKKRGASLGNSTKYSLDTFKVLVLFLLAKIGLTDKIFRKPEQNINTRTAKIV